MQLNIAQLSGLLRFFLESICVVWLWRAKIFRIRKGTAFFGWWGPTPRRSRTGSGSGTSLPRAPIIAKQGLKYTVRLLWRSYESPSKSPFLWKYIHYHSISLIQKLGPAYFCINDTKIIHLLYKLFAFNIQKFYTLFSSLFRTGLLAWLIGNIVLETKDLKIFSLMYKDLRILGS